MIRYADLFKGVVVGEHQRRVMALSDKLDGITKLNPVKQAGHALGVIRDALEILKGIAIDLDQINQGGDR